MAFITFQPSDHFNTVLYTGNGSTQSITGVGFQPDMTWGKARSTTTNHVIQTSVQGLSTAIFPNLDNSESTGLTNAITSFDSDGFSLGDWSPLNASSQTFVSWNWKANGAGSTNTDGNMNTTVTTSANTTSGVSVITWTGSGNTTYNTIGHGLGAAPKMFMVKNLTNSADWIVYHASLGATKYLKFNTTVGQASATDAWNDTAPTSSVITLGSADTTNGTGKSMVAYAFAEVKGFSKFGSYTGNGNDDGPFIYTGFKPSFVIIKSYAGGTGQWLMFDNKRNDSNVVNKFLKTDDSAAEGTSSTANKVDFCSNGIKIRENNGDLNLSSSLQYIYMAFAEEPLVSSNNIPSTAR